jgi:hypothetical protein
MGKKRAVGSNLICKGICKRSLLGFRYRGLHRVVEPYCHRISTGDAEVLRAVQIRGASSSSIQA